MITQTIVSNVGDIRFPQPGEDGGDDQEGDAIDSSMRFPMPPEAGAETQIFETNFDLSAHPIGALRLGEMPLIGEGVRHIAEELRTQLHDFVHANMRRPSGYGFLAKGYESPTLTPILDAMKSASQKLEQMFNDRSHDDVMTIQVRSAAHRVQNGLEGFLVNMLRGDPRATISETELGPVLHQCIELKGFLGTSIQQIDLMNAEYRAAVLVQLENMQNGRGGAARHQK